MIGTNIKEIRKKKAISQDKLARIANIPYTTLVKIESNIVKNPSVQNIAKIAKALDVNIEKLLE
jgi:transcriptional regulator with XRE-family HTH domain